jgi:hypothetical protein
MTPLHSHIGPTIDTTTDVGAIWKAAIDRYEKITKVKVESLSGTSNMDQILAEIQERETAFERYRHDGSRLDRFRTLVKNSLAPIQMLGDIVAHATKSVRKSSQLAH